MAALATIGTAPRPGPNRVLLLLVAAALIAALSLGFVTVAPNRLLSGIGVPLSQLFSGPRWALLLPAAVLLLAPFLPATRATHGLVLGAATAWIAGALWLAGDEAAARSAAAAGQTPNLERVSLGGAFWILAGLAWLAAADAWQRLQLRRGPRTLVQLMVLLPVGMLVVSGALDHLSLFKEYANRRDVFEAAGWRHLQIVGTTLLPALLVGVPLGVAAARSERLARPLLALLNVIQTVPSIALFGLLMAPLGALALLLPGLGIQGIGLWPAVIALTLYALLPIVHATASGLRQVPTAAVSAAAGMGLTPRQVFWQVEAPLALPVLLSGLRVTTVQLLGLTVVAALIGAGGFGAVMFQGLFSSAIDLVLLGVLPVLAMALVADAGLALLTGAVERRLGR